MLGNPNTRSGSYKSGGRTDIESMRSIAARATGIDQAVNWNLDASRNRANDFCSSNHLINRLALHAKRHQEAADLSRAGLTGHDGVHDITHFGMSQARPFNEKTDGVTNIHGISL